MKNIKLLWGIIILLLVIVFGMGYKFVSGSVTPSEDGRTSVILNKDERNLILDEMRAFLVSVQAVSQGITENDTARVATKAGMVAEADTPGSIFRKIPIAMKTLEFDTRKKFDEIAKTAKEQKSTKILRKQLDNLMNNCIACNATFKLPEPVK
jgi:multidrug efflux pump subunit AcrB